jgi:Lrp/AsnC family transcriptional regulator, leucine-responsive regulatory protein
MRTATFDEYDRRILTELQSDARLSMAELGRRVLLSQPSVAERVRKLEEAGVITGYKANVDLAALGYGLHALLRVGRGETARLTQLIARSPEVVCAYAVAGEDCLWVEIAVVDVKHLAAVVAQFGVLAPTATSIVLNTVRERHTLLPAVGSEPLHALKGLCTA